MSLSLSVHCAGTSTSSPNKNLNGHCHLWGAAWAFLLKSSPGIPVMIFLGEPGLGDWAAGTSPE